LISNSNSYIKKHE